MTSNNNDNPVANSDSNTTATTSSSIPPPPTINEEPQPIPSFPYPPRIHSGQICRVILRYLPPTCTTIKDVEIIIKNMLGINNIENSLPKSIIVESLMLGKPATARKSIILPHAYVACENEATVVDLCQRFMKSTTTTTAIQCEPAPLQPKRGLDRYGNRNSMAETWQTDPELERFKAGGILPMDKTITNNSTTTTTSIHQKKISPLVEEMRRIMENKANKKKKSTSRSKGGKNAPATTSSKKSSTKNKSSSKAGTTTTTTGSNKSTSSNTKSNNTKSNKTTTATTKPTSSTVTSNS
jgi:hypothetical protein